MPILVRVNKIWSAMPREHPNYHELWADMFARMTKAPDGPRQVLCRFNDFQAMLPMVWLL